MVHSTYSEKVIKPDIVVDTILDTEISEESPLIIILEEKSGSSWPWTACILANVILGVGLLNYPASYHAAGGATVGISVQACCIVIIFYGLYMMGECADKASKDSYQATVNHFCGQFSLIVCNFFIVVHNFGACITLLVILGDQIDQVMIYSVGYMFCKRWYYKRLFTLTMASLITLPLCFYTRLDKFKFVSFIGITAITYMVLLVTTKYFMIDKSDVEIVHKPHLWSDIFKVVPVICFSFEGHIEAIPLYACLRERHIHNFGKVLLLALLIPFTVYGTVGSLAYLSMGEDTPSDFLHGYHLDVWVLGGTVIIAIKSLVTYPEIFFCSRMVIDDQLHPYYSKVGICQGQSLKILTVILFFASLVIAHSVPNIGSIISVLGGSSALFIFIFPGLCSMQAHMEATTVESCFKKYAGVAMVVVGTFLAVTTTVQAIMDMSKENINVKDFCSPVSQNI